jgi:hypothetical protein
MNRLRDALSIALYATDGDWERAYQAVVDRAKVDEEFLVAIVEDLWPHLTSPEETIVGAEWEAARQREPDPEIRARDLQQRFDERENPELAQRMRDHIITTIRRVLEVVVRDEAIQWRAAHGLPPTLDDDEDEHTDG